MRLLGPITFTTLPQSAYHVFWVLHFESSWITASLKTLKISFLFKCFYSRMYILYFYHIHRLLSRIIPLSHQPLFHVHVSGRSCLHLSLVHFELVTLHSICGLDWSWLFYSRVVVEKAVPCWVSVVPFPELLGLFSYPNLSLVRLWQSFVYYKAVHWRASTLIPMLTEVNMEKSYIKYIHMVGIWFELFD